MLSRQVVLSTYENVKHSMMGGWTASHVISARDSQLQNACCPIDISDAGR